MSKSVHIFLLGVTLLFAIFAWSIYCPIPDGFSDPWAVRKLHVFFTSNIKTAQWMHRMGWRDMNDFMEEAFATRKARVDGVKVTDSEIEGVPIRIRTPRSPNGETDRLLPAFVFYHGGAYLLGDRYSHDRMLQELSRDLGLVVISVSYRLAPRHLWPAQHEDTLVVAKYILEHGDELGVDSERVALGGDSAGAHLVAGVSMRLSIEGFPLRPKVQCLVYPVCQFLDFALPSYMQNEGGPVLTRDMVLFSVSNVLLGNDSIVSALENNEHVSHDVMSKVGHNINHDFVPEEMRNAPYGSHREHDQSARSTRIPSHIRDVFLSPYFSLLVAENLTDQPKTFLFTAQNDVLRDDGFLYAKALRDAGNDVTHVHHPKGIHGMMRFYSKLLEGQEFFDALVDFLIENL